MNSRLDAIEQETSGVTARTRGPKGIWWRGSYLVGCDGPRSTVRKLQDIRFPGRTAVERYAVAALRVELPWPNRALLHRTPPWRTSGPSAGEISARPLPDGVWRLDWLLPPGKDLVTPELLVTRVQETLAGWTGGSTPPYELLDTGVHTVHHRLARRWRAGRVFLAGDAAHLLGALGTQGLEEGLKDADNLAWKLALTWHHGPRDVLLDSYQAERRASVAARLRAADQVLPLLRGGGALRSYVPGASRSHDALLTDGHLGRGALGAPATYADSPLAPRHIEAEVPVETRPGAPVTDVRVTAEDGSFVRLRDRLGRGALLVVLIAPGTGVWERKHWVSAGIMPRLAAASPRFRSRPNCSSPSATPARPPTPCSSSGPTATWSRPSTGSARPSSTRRPRRPWAARPRPRPRPRRARADHRRGAYARLPGVTQRPRPLCDAGVFRVWVGGRRPRPRDAVHGPRGRWLHLRVTLSRPRRGDVPSDALSAGERELTGPDRRGVLRIVTDTCVRLWRRVHMDLIRYAGCVCRPSC
ncbi:hypothetical protein GCM10020295_21430 [Streptomyces cinereospinus]